MLGLNRWRPRRAADLAFLRLQACQELQIEKRLLNQLYCWCPFAAGSIIRRTRASIPGPMTRRLISTGSPLEASAGYSRAVVDGDFCFVAGTTGYDYATMQMPDDVAAQTRNCFTTISKVLSDAGFALADVVRARYYIVDHADAEAVLAVCGEYFRDIRPAATIVVVAGLLRAGDAGRDRGHRQTAQPVGRCTLAEVMISGGRHHDCVRWSPRKTQSRSPRNSCRQRETLRPASAPADAPSFVVTGRPIALRSLIRSSHASLQSCLLQPHLAAVLLASVPASAQTMNEKTVTVGGAPMYPSKNIIQNAMNSKDHTTLVAAVKAAGLVDTLARPGPVHGVRADQCGVRQAAAGTVDKLVKPENKATLTKILTYHVVPGRLTAMALMKAIKDGEGEPSSRPSAAARSGSSRPVGQACGHRRQGRCRHGDHRRM